MSEFDEYMRGRQLERNPFIGPSTAKNCYRQHAYRYFGAQATDEVSTAAADFGTLLHLGWSEMIRRLYDPLERAADVVVQPKGMPRPGEADDVDFVNRTVTDLKTISGKVAQSWANRGGPYESYWDQLEVYALGLRQEFGGDWSLRIVAFDVETRTRQEFVKPADPVYAQSIVDRVVERHDALLGALSIGGSPEDFPREGNGPGSFPCGWCCAPGTKVLRPDFTWVDIADVRVGDILLGRDEYPGKSGKARLRKTVVTRVHRRTADRVSVDGSLVVAATKKFWAQSRWTPVTGIAGKAVQFLAAPVDEDTAMYERGWLAGMADGDGSFWSANGKHRHRHFRIALRVDADLLLDAFKARAARAGFVLRDGTHRGGLDGGTMRCLRLQRHKECARFEEWIEEDVDHPSWHWGYLAGIADAEGSVTGRSGTVRSGGVRISQYRDASPREYARIGASLAAVGVAATAEEKGYYLSSANGGLWKFLSGAHPLRPVFSGLAVDRVPHHSRVVASVEPVGRGEVVSIQTDSGTYIAEGYVVHNCPFMSACWGPQPEDADMTVMSASVQGDADAVAEKIVEYLAASADESAAKARKQAAGGFLKGLVGKYELPDGSVGSVSVVGGKLLDPQPDAEAMVARLTELGEEVPFKFGMRTARYTKVLRLKAGRR